MDAATGIAGYPSLWAAIESIAPKIGGVPQTLQDWVRQSEVESGAGWGMSTLEAQRMKDLEGGQGMATRQCDPEVGQCASRPSGARPPPEAMYRLAYQHRCTNGGKSICTVLQIAPSAHRRHAARHGNQTLMIRRAQRDIELMPVVKQVLSANLQAHGADKVWAQMNREGGRWLDARWRG